MNILSWTIVIIIAAFLLIVVFLLFFQLMKKILLGKCEEDPIGLREGEHKQ